MMDQLVQCLSDDNHPSLQKIAVGTLCNLAQIKLLRATIVNCPNALELLTALLSKDHHPDLQRLAANAIIDLSILEDDETKMKIVSCRGTVDQLVRCLSKERAHPDLSNTAAVALAGLAQIDKTTLTIGNFGSVDRLQYNDPVVNQQLAASAVCTLAVREMIEIERKFDQYLKQKAAALTNAVMEIMNFPAGVEKLMGALYNGGILHCQMVAARTICFLSENLLWVGKANLEKEMIKFRTFEGVTEGLSRQLAKQVSPRTQGWASKALTYINPSEANKARLYSGTAYSGRGRANLYLDLYKEALSDYDKANELQPGDQSTLR